jgi:hypothetical protein
MLEAPQITSSGGKPMYKQIHVHNSMSTKTITITEEAYERLKSRKGENQSIS